MLVLGSGCLNCVTPLYRKSNEDSNILHNLIDHRETWDKPEKAEKWRAKLPQPEAARE